MRTFSLEIIPVRFVRTVQLVNTAWYTSILATAFRTLKSLQFYWRCFRKFISLNESAWSLRFSESENLFNIQSLHTKAKGKHISSFVSFVPPTIRFSKKQNTNYISATTSRKA